MINARRVYAATGAATCWLGLAAQFYLIARDSPRTVGGMAGALATFFSFFTLWTNLLVALVWTAAARSRDSSSATVLNRADVATATASYIGVAGIVYSLVLRSLWSPTGLRLLLDRVQHDIVPIAFVVYWIAFVPKEAIRWRDTLLWLIFPAAYVLFAGIRGAIVGRYPYPFISVVELGYARALFNALVVAVLIWGGALVFAAIARAMAKRRSRAVTA